MWSDRYIGLPYKRHGRDRNGTDCFGLLRMVWSELCGFTMPPFAMCREQEKTIRHQAFNFEEILMGDLSDRDAVLMNEDLAATSGVIARPVHIGIFVKPHFVLHIEEERTSFLQPIKELWVSRCYRSPEPI